MQNIVLTATFTAEPVQDSLQFWMSELDVPCTINFAPYNQVFQQLLDPASVVSMNSSGLNVVLVRLEDWWCGVANSGPAGHEDTQQRVGANAEELVEALQFAVGNSKVPYLLCFCPGSRQALSNAATAAFFQALENRIARRLKDAGGIFVVTSAECAALYPVADYDDPRSNEVSHVPYTQEFFHGLGTLIARRFYRIHTPPHKVIVLDCDNTLWQGVTGEDGALGVSVGPGHRALQQFAMNQREAGMLVCLCSKNNEPDVWEVFAKNSGMILQREHIVASRINWLPKSENLRSLAAELQLGTDSFIFLDDSGVECAEVEARCPEALALQLPEDPGDFQKFLSHVWAFDHLRITDADRQRSDQYAQEAGRKHLLAQSPRLEDFLAGLDLQIEFLPMTRAEMPRVAQLTQRTNQFNFTGVRRSESDVAQLCSAGNAGCLVVRLRDRFGDYGLVGAMIFSRRADFLDVDNVLLSCRALGRRVEHRMLSRLGRMAREEGLGKVRVNFISTPKNQPAREFLESLGASVAAGSGGRTDHDFEAAYLADLFIGPHGEPAAGVGRPGAGAQDSAFSV
jgi:FkbH-like protein